MKAPRRCWVLWLAGSAACAGSHTSPKQPSMARPELKVPSEPADPEAVTESPPLLIFGGTVLTAAGSTLAPGYISLENGRIRAVAAGAPPADDATPRLDATGLYITPGIIDTHSHMGVFPIPNVTAHEDGNELTKPTTPELWAEHSFWPQDPGLRRAVAQGGVTTIQVLPGSGNLIGGRSFIAKLRPATNARDMRFAGAPQGLKMACGENPKSVYGSKGQAPSTRMGNLAGFRKAFQEALEYRYHWQKYAYDLAQFHAKDDPDASPPDPPERDLGNETLAAVLDGKILVQNHCYRADEMHIMLDLAQEFGFKIRSFHHGLEAYKMRRRLAAEHVAISTWVDWWGYKLEALDGVPYNAAMLADAGVVVAMHSDSETEVRHLNQEAAKAQAAGRALGLLISDNEALRWVTANPAWVLGVDSQVGTLEPGKMADLVVWDHPPLSVYARPVRVFIDGTQVYDRQSVAVQESDFELEQVNAGGTL